MDLHLIENIVAIADEKSITKAAEKRFICFPSPTLVA